MGKTLYNTVLVRRSLSPATRTNGTVNGAAVDRQSVTAIGNGHKHRTFRSAVVVVNTGTITDGSHAITVEDSDDGSTGWAAVPDAQLQGSEPTVVAANDDTQFEIGVLSSKRFLRVTAVTSGATTGGVFGAVVVLGDPTNAPVR